MKVTEIACGARHSLFLLTSGHVMAVGCNQLGQIGNNSMDDAVIPTKLEDLSSISHIGCGNSHSLASDGKCKSPHCNINCTVFWKNIIEKKSYYRLIMLILIFPSEDYNLMTAYLLIFLVTLIIVHVQMLI